VDTSNLESSSTEASGPERTLRKRSSKIKRNNSKQIHLVSVVRSPVKSSSDDDEDSDEDDEILTPPQRTVFSSEETSVTSIVCIC